MISKRKPDEEKLVGRVTIDLSEVINSGIFENMENHFLTFCSVKDGSLTFNLKVKSKEKTDMKHNEL